MKKHDEEMYGCINEMILGVSHSLLRAIIEQLATDPRNEALTRKLESDFKEYFDVHLQVYRERGGETSLKDVACLIPNNSWIRIIEIIREHTAAEQFIEGVCGRKDNPETH